MHTCTHTFPLTQRLARAHLSSSMHDLVLCICYFNCKRRQETSRISLICSHLLQLQESEKLNNSNVCTRLMMPMWTFSKYGFPHLFTACGKLKFIGDAMRAQVKWMMKYVDRISNQPSKLDKPSLDSHGSSNGGVRPTAGNIFTNNLSSTFTDIELPTCLPSSTSETLRITVVGVIPWRRIISSKLRVRPRLVMKCPCGLDCE